MGNNGNHGVKGRSGRKGALVELNDARMLHDMFFGDREKSETLDKLKAGRYSLKDVFVSKAYSGNERFLLALFNKNFPDAALKGLSPEGQTVVNVVDYAADSVKSIDDVLTFLNDTIRRVREGNMELDQANTLGRLANTSIKAIEVGELKDKLDLLNSVIQQRKSSMKK